MRRKFIDTMETAGSLAPDLNRAPSSRPHDPRILETLAAVKTEKIETGKKESGEKRSKREDKGIE